ncbi:hypothetical protein M422DRAFT_261646 [Sphaerobolus stellatus SS14]|uniref:Peptidase C14 caspase domain-containing protein n=1 Tax=Sphaerobolus stellatus (strain SS14) TaxID=990650 RepID=A0A0C9UMM4_SPHS4|nr:hypothetical protein M422DRAFT_261646 [Sphaerobolus stellatus SS14]
MILSSLGTPISKFSDLFWYLLHEHRESHTALDLNINYIQAAATVAAPVVIEDKRNIFALIIGINVYADATVISSLKGPVPDAQAFRDYLLKDLHVSQENIKILLNQEATRSQIIEGFLALQGNARIKKGDAIVIFYAGHGLEADSPPGWESGDPDNKIQMILPYDFTKQDGYDIHGIPDRTIAALLDGLAEAKGDNITVIFDCCHSGGGARNETDDEELVRSVDIDVTVPADLDKSIWSGDDTHRGISFPEGFLHRGLNSHVLLAACGAKESAYERRGRGNFTQALLKLLKTVSAEKLTYASVLQKMEKIRRQNPQCEGANRNRILFNSRPPPAGPHYFYIYKKHHEYILAAGEIHGVTAGDEFTIYSDKTSSTPLGVLTVPDDKSIGPFSTTLYPQTSIPILFPEHSVAVKSKAGKTVDLLLQAPLDVRLMSLYKKLSKLMEQNDPTGIHLVKEGAGAKLGIRITPNNQIAFDVLDPEVTLDGSGVTQLPYTVDITDVEQLYLAIRRAAHYYRCLGYEGNNKTIRNNVSVEFIELKYTGFHDIHGLPFTEPIGNPLNSNGVVDIVPRNSIYGFKVINNSSRDLYMNAFYFDNVDFSIDSYYKSHTAGQFITDPTLKANGGSVTIGYGSGGAMPFKFVLNYDDVDTEIGFMKIFLTSENVDLSSISQASPFSPDKRKITEAKPHMEPISSTALLKIVQRRFPATSSSHLEHTLFPIQVPKIMIPKIAAQSASNILVEADSRHNVFRRYWFGVQMKAEELPGIISVQLETSSKGFARESDDVQGGWFELAVMPRSYPRGTRITKKLLETKRDKSKILLTWHSHNVVLHKQYQNQSGIVFGEDADLWKHISGGDWISVLACARSPKSVCDGSVGKLIINEYAD